ncbi:arabinose transporter [Yokenella regensburgei]|uniref:arabinose transporter n=1 Tax=Yokenella regensburgei TaxID=158877 RepID=UPI003F182550
MPTSTTTSEIPAASGRLIRLSLAMFFAYMTVGLPLTAIPLFVHQQLGLSDTWVGVAVGIQFLATVLTRSYAGRLADSRGAKRTTLQGLLVCGLAGIAYLFAALFAADVWLALCTLLIGRLLLGLGESQILTGNLTWGMGLAGSAQAGKVISWNGMATYGALACGAPLGAFLYLQAGFIALGMGTIVLPLVALLINSSVLHVAPHPGNRVPLRVVLNGIWRPGLALALQGIGFAAISAFIALYFAARGWGNAGFALTAFGGLFILVRLLLGQALDRYGAATIATLSLLVECAGLLIIWLAATPVAALLGAALTGAGCSLVFPSLGVVTVRAVSPQVRGTALGGFSAFQDIAYGITGPLAGLLAGVTGYEGIYFAAACCALAGAVAIRTLIHSAP